MGAFAVAGVGLLMSSTAYACTVYQGKMTASGNGNGNVAQTTYGATGFMQWCTLDTPTVTVNYLTPQITVSTAKTIAGDGCAAGKLTQRFTYRVAVTQPGSGHMPQGGGAVGLHNCHQSGAAQNTPIASGTVDNTGVFTAVGGNTINYAAYAGLTGPNSVCIYNLNDDDAAAVNMDAVV